MLRPGKTLAAVGITVPPVVLCKKRVRWALQLGMVMSFLESMMHLQGCARVHWHGP